MRGDAAEVKALLITGRDPNEKMTSWFNLEPLSWAATMNQLECIVNLIEYGADPRPRKNDMGSTPVGDANREENFLAAEMLNTFMVVLA